VFLAYYLGFALFGALTFALGWRVAHAGKWPAFAGYGVVLTLLLTKAVLNHNPPWEFALFGGWRDYIFVQSYLIFPLGLACLGLATGLLPPGRNRRAVTVLAGFLVLVSLWTERWMFVQPDNSSTARADAEHLALSENSIVGPRPCEDKPREAAPPQLYSMFLLQGGAAKRGAAAAGRIQMGFSDRAYCPQSSGYSCGPAACVSLLSVLGVDATEGEMMELCRTPTYGGTSLFRICRGLRLKLGDKCNARIIDGDPERLRAHGGPAIVAVRRMHAVTLYFVGEDVVVLDPGLGAPKTITFEECVERYGGDAVIVDGGTRSGS